MSSARSKGFFNKPGAAAPKLSLAKQSANTKKPNPHAHGWQYQANPARASSGVWNHVQLPTTETPSNGEIATPVISVMPSAKATPGVRPSSAVTSPWTSDAPANINNSNRQNHFTDTS
ncbi:MAG: hypothetical protein ACO3JG_06260 [Luteolibacter sp.]